MADTVTMPKLGFDMAEGTLVRWVKAEGEAVNRGEVLAEIETDKATVEVESGFSGIVHRHLVEQGAIVPVGAPIAIIAEPGEKVEEAPVAANISEAEKPGVPQKTEEPAEVPVVHPGVMEPSGMVKASPLAKHLALENGLDLSAIQGSGPGGRIVRKDVEAVLVAQRTALKPVVAKELGATPSLVSAAAEPASVQSKPAAIAVPLPQWAAGSTQADETVTIGRLRAAIGRRMTESKQQVPHFYITHEYDMEAVMKLRKEINSLLPEEQKLSVNDFIIRAVALTLRQFPNLNASISGNQVVRHGQVNVGVAVAVEGGLLTVVCKATDQKPLRQISMEVKEMVARARVGKVRPDDIEGSTFSISNLGMFDVENFVAIINPPEAAILAIGSAKEVPVVVNGELKVGFRMNATISADHRVTDGAEAAQFLQILAKYLERPMTLLV